MRALEPVATGFTVNPEDGVRIAWEMFGPDGARDTIVFLPTWSIVHSRIWKLQTAYFAGHGFRVVTFDGRGNGLSDRPDSGYTTAHFVTDTLAVLDELGIEQAAFVGFSAGAKWGIQLAAEHPERVNRLALIGPAIRFDETPASLRATLEPPPDREGRNKYNAVYWSENYRDFLEWFFAEVSNEPHSTKQIDDGVAWGLETTPEVLTATTVERVTPRLAEFAAAVTCPVLILHGVDDTIIPIDLGRAAHAVLPNSTLVEMPGCGHAPLTRDPVAVNRMLHDFFGRESPAERTWRRAMIRPKRALFVSSPIGLGHAQRDVAIAGELRRLVPGLEIDWLAQNPVTSVLEARGERIHPLSCRLAGESPHIESQMTGEHELNVFQAWREMDEILLSNFMTFLDAAEEGNYDLWIGDEAWEVDYFLHENPELKTASFAWLTDFVGWLPMPPDDGGRETMLTADYNAEMIEQVARYPRVRDVALFIGNPDDIVPDQFGPELPPIRDWTEENFDFTGYVRYVDPDIVARRDGLRERFGFTPDESVIVVSVGGTSVGAGLLRRIVDAVPELRRRVPGARFIVVCGPRIDPATLPQRPGVEYRGYVHNLYELLAASDAALVQGGLTTTMELVAAHRPFLAFPLARHFEQNRHVAHRLRRYGVPEWASVSVSDSDPTTIAERLERVLSDPVQYREIELDGARCAAQRIAALL